MDYILLDLIYYWVDALQAASPCLLFDMFALQDSILYVIYYVCKKYRLSNNLLCIIFELISHLTNQVKVKVKMHQVARALLVQEKQKEVQKAVHKLKGKRQ